MPPQPKTAIEEPASTCAVRITAPKPVITAQPSSAAASSGISSAIFTTPFSWSSICSDQPKMFDPHWLRRWPFQDITGGSSAPAPGAARTDVEVPRQAHLAVATERAARDHVVARLHVAHAAPDALDDARGLVAEHGGRRHGRVALDHMQLEWQTPAAAVRTSTS